MRAKKVKKIIAVMTSVAMLFTGMNLKPAAAAAEETGQPTGMIIDYAPEFRTVFQNYVTTQGIKLMDGDKELKFASLNYPQATSDNEWEQRNAIKTIEAMGGNVTRTYTIPVYNGKNAGTAYVTGVDGQGNLTFNEDALNKLDKLLAICNEYGIRVIIPLVDHWHWVGGIDGYCRLAGITINTTDSLDPNAWQFYTNETCRELFEQMISHLMERTNTVTGVKYKDDPAVLCWETGNEIAAYDSTSNPKFPQDWTTEIAAHLKSAGIKQLVLDGKMDATAASLTDPNVDILGSHYYTGSFSQKLKNDTEMAHANGNGKPFILGEFGTYTKYQDVDKVFKQGIDSGTNGIMMWSLRAHKDGYGYYFHPEDPGNWAAYHWPGFPSGDYYDETNIVRTIYAYAQLMNGKAATIEEARLIPIPAPETEESPLLYSITSVGDIKWRGVVGGAWYEIQRAEGENPSEGDWKTIADKNDYVYDSGRNWENKEVPCIAGYHDITAITGETYSYRLRACNETGAGLWSNAVSTESASHDITDNLDMISVSSTDQNPAEIRNTYSYDHSANVTVSGSTLKNDSSTDGYITYFTGDILSKVSIVTKGEPSSAPRAYVSKDDITYQEIGLTKDGVKYSSDSIPEGSYFLRVYIGGNNACILDSIQVIYSFHDEAELYQGKKAPANAFIQDETFDSANPLYAYKSNNLDYTASGDVKGLATKDENGAELIYKTGDDMTSYRITLYAKDVSEVKVEYSMDGVLYTKISPNDNKEMSGEYTKLIFADLDVTNPVRFIKITYPAGKEKVIVKSVEAASGSKRLPMADKAPVNVLEDGEYYFGSLTKLQAAYTLSLNNTTGLFIKELNNIDFSGYDCLYAWVKGNGTSDKAVLRLTDKNGIQWEADSVMGGSSQMLKFEFNTMRAVAGEGYETAETPDFSKVADFRIGVESADGSIDGMQLVLDENNFYTGNYGVGITYQKGGQSYEFAVDNIYVSSLTKVDDYEGYNGSNTLLNAAYSRNTGGGAFNISLDVEKKSEASYGMRIDYDYGSAGYAGATKTMDYLNLKDYDGIKLWYVPDGSGNSLTIQLQTSDGLSWESVGLMTGAGPTELYMPFESFKAPSWDPRTGTLDNNLNIVKFSIYTNQVKEVTKGTLYFDDIKGADFKDDLKDAKVAIANADNETVTQFPYKISGTAEKVNYAALKIGSKSVNVPVVNGMWEYELTKDSKVYNGTVDVSASINYHNGDVIASDNKKLTLNVEGNVEVSPVQYEKVYEMDFSSLAGIPSDWTITQSGADGKIENSLLWWAQNAYSVDVKKEINVPDGIYQMTAKMRVKSGFTDSRMYAVTGEDTYKSNFLDTTDTWKDITIENIKVTNGKLSLGFLAQAPDGTDGLVFAIQKVTLYKTADVNHMPNGDMESHNADWPNLPEGYTVTYTGGDGWSPVKTETNGHQAGSTADVEGSRKFAGYADNAYTYDLSREVSGLRAGTYELSAWIKLSSDGSFGDGYMEALVNGTNRNQVHYDNTQKGKWVQLTLTGIKVTDGDLFACHFYGEVTKKGFGLDDIFLKRTGDLESVVSADITPRQQEYDKYTSSGGGISFTVIWGDAAVITGITSSGEVVSGSACTVSGSALTINDSFLMSQPVGQKQLTVTFDKGNPVILTIDVKDTTPGSTPDPDPDPDPNPAPNPAPSPSVTPAKPVLEGYGSGWENIKTALASLKNTNVILNMNQETSISGDIFKVLKDNKLIVKFVFDGYSWTVDGKDITGNIKDVIDLSLTKSESGLPLQELKELTGSSSYIPLHLNYEGEFGFKAELTLTAPSTNKGLAGNLFYYDKAKKTFELISLGRVKENGEITLEFTHASDYALVFSDKPMLSGELKNIKVTPAAKTLYAGGTTGKTAAVKAVLTDNILAAKESGLSNISISYKSADTKVAAVSKSGTVTAKGAGSTTVKTTVTIDGYSKTFVTKIKVAKAEVKLINPVKSMKLGSTLTFRVKVSGYLTKDVTFSTLSAGKVVIGKTTGKATAKSKGTDTVVVHYGKHKQKYSVTVK
ncbi:carbohydrate binding domain-containing protein [Anaerocolumna xylanovorans]|uniref:mannan endo-1,4-beta-mannosidase n=1 Tax=Anaerocolumna xylanovorans DSM 12503 TaxID=1121345 RepID=A0A1M7Y958_9FIRM|nr:carbohydrate binding domain-containing protein [Anaerocolumna xylanovorans]SHO49139.1 Carbohydrate binding domain (family 11) [Anaerocolumna xylanovorans DSM 12503]